MINDCYNIYVIIVNFQVLVNPRPKSTKMIKPSIWENTINYQTIKGWNKSMLHISYSGHDNTWYCKTKPIELEYFFRILRIYLK